MHDHLRSYARLTTLWSLRMDIVPALETQNGSLPLETVELPARRSGQAR